MTTTIVVMIVILEEGSAQSADDRSLLGCARAMTNRLCSKLFFGSSSLSQKGDG